MKPKTALFIILALAALAVANYTASRLLTDAAPYESFAMIMDRLSGPGQWSAQSHEESSQGLMVKDLTFPASSSLIVQAEGEGRDGQVSLASVFIKKL
ncbi:MAG: hypothetical protein LBV70_07560, partial [Candidatus Adiutrix sp.]|nr:hypothetical protein [Candidatus Adiutrix sp.]